MVSPNHQSYVAVELLILKLRQHPDASADAAVTRSSQNNRHVEAVDVTKIKGICICEWH
jgi:hypothetical protein